MKKYAIPQIKTRRIEFTLMEVMSVIDQKGDEQLGNEYGGDFDFTPKNKSVWE